MEALTGGRCYEKAQMHIPKLLKGVQLLRLSESAHKIET